MSEANPQLGDPVENLLLLVAEAIADDVEAVDWCADRKRGLIIDRNGHTFVVRVEERDE